MCRTFASQQLNGLRYFVEEVIARPENAYPSSQSVSIAASLEERSVVPPGMRTITVEQKHLHIYCQYSASGTEQ